jgi:hypothetical protein
MAFVFRGHVLRPRQHLPALRTAHFQQFTVHMDDMVVSGAFVQVVYILRHQ